MSKRKLTGKQQSFVIAYLTNGFNATEAVRTAGYKGNNVTLNAVGYENLRKPHIQERIVAYFKEKAMAVDEVLFRLGEQARSNVADFIDTPTERIFFLNMEKIKAKGHLIRKIKYTKDGPEIELYSSQRALELIGKRYALFSEKMILSWQEEAEKAGIPASILFERMVAEIMAELQKQNVSNSD